MSDTELDQSRIYREYFELVQAFNSANDKYTKVVNEAEENRKLAVEQAIKDHLNPTLSMLQIVQAVSLIIILASTFFFLVGISLSSSPTSNYQATGGIVFLVSLLGGIIGMVGIIQASTKANTLSSEKRWAKEHIPKLPD